MRGTLARLGPVLSLAGLLVLGGVALPSLAPAMVPDAGSVEAETPVEMKVGETKVIKIPGLSRIAVGDPEIADIKAGGNSEVVITARAPGKTMVLAWGRSGVRKAYLVNVTK